jgi:hypothetical protein
MPKKALWAVNMGGTLLGRRLAVKGECCGKDSPFSRLVDATLAPLTRFSGAFTRSQGPVSGVNGPSTQQAQPLQGDYGVSWETGFSFMTTLRFSALAACLLASVAFAKAETRTFIMDSSEGYGVDSCLAKGEACGKAMATAVCQANQFASAVDFGRMDPTEITGSVPAGMQVKACAGGKCPEKVAITCTR